jgi:hypothetical protein
MRAASDSPTTIGGSTKHHISNRMKRRAAAPQPKANTNTFTDILVSLAFDWLFAPPGRIRSAKNPDRDHECAEHGERQKLRDGSGRTQSKGCAEGHEVAGDVSREEPLKCEKSCRVDIAGGEAQEQR